MKAQDLKGELLQDTLQHGDQPRFRNLRGCANDLPLGHFIHRVDVIDALDSVKIALMHGVNADVTRLPVRLRPPPLPDRYLRGPRLLYRSEEHTSELQS